MNFGKNILGLTAEQRMKVNPKTNTEEYYENAPLCKYNKGACVCKRQLNNGPVKCFFKQGPKKCCFEKEQPSSVLERSKS